MNSEDVNVGSITKNDTTKIIVQLKRFKGAEFIDVREYVESSKYTGYSPKGVNFCSEVWTEFFELMEKLNDAICNEPEDDMTDG